MAAPAVEPLAATEAATKQYGIASLSDLQLRIADNSDALFKVHKQVLAHHSTFFQHLIEADPHLNKIELANNLPITAADIDLFLQTIYGNKGCYLQAAAIACKSQRHVFDSSPHFSVGQTVQWDGRAYHVRSEYTAGQQVPLRRGALEYVDSYIVHGGGYSYASYTKEEVDEQKLCQQNNVRYNPKSPCEVAEKLLPSVVYFHAEKLLDECTSLIRAQFRNLSAQQKVSWLAKMDEISSVEAFTHLLEQVSVAELRQAAAAGVNWSTRFRMQTLGVILDKVLKQ